MTAGPGPRGVRAGTGTSAAVRARMLARLADQVVRDAGDAGDAAGTGAPGGRRPLAALTTRAADDPTVALVDAVAGVCDVLSFYADRIAVEGYLGTAVEPRSVTEIATALGYVPGPGASAAADLTFTVDPQHPGAVTVPARHAVLSVPTASDVPPVTYETDDDLVARAEWNALRPAATRPQRVTAQTRELVLAGATGGPAVGNPLAIRLGAAWRVHVVTAVVADPARGVTVVRVGDGVAGLGPLPPGTHAVTAFAERARPFGAQAPDARLMPAGTPATIVVDGEWTGFGLPTGAVLDLDREYRSATPGSLLLLQEGASAQLVGVDAVTTVGRSDFGLSGSVTRVTAGAEVVPGLVTPGRRTAQVLVGGHGLALAAEAPDDTAVEGTTLRLDGVPATPLPPGRVVLVVGEGIGEDAGPGGAVVHRTTVVAPRPGQDPPAPDTLLLADAVPRIRRATVTVHANVAGATHGATVREEVLGSGDAGAVRQAFRLRQQPLSWLRRSDGGVAPALEVRVNGVRWTRRETLDTSGPADRVYTLRAEPDGGTAVVFGDGRRGARLPTGTENVRATYRVGLGAAGDVPAGRLYLLRDRPPGLTAVTNPAAAGGGAEPDAVAVLRQRGPMTLAVTGRLVSAADHAAVAAVHPGIGKATAAVLWPGVRPLVHVTVAGTSGEVLAPDDPALVSLARRLRTGSGPGHGVAVSGHTPQWFTVRLTVTVVAGADAGAVVDAVRAALAATFSFAERAFAQDVTTAEVVRCAHRVPGVLAVDLDDVALRGSDRSAVRGVLSAAPAEWGPDGVAPAELLLVDVDASTVTGVGAP